MESQIVEKAKVRTTELALDIQLAAENLQASYGLQKIITAYGATRDIRAIHLLSKQTMAFHATTRREFLGSTINDHQELKNIFVQLNKNDPSTARVHANFMDNEIWITAPIFFENVDLSIVGNESFILLVQLSTDQYFNSFFNEFVSTASLFIFILVFMFATQMMTISLSIFRPIARIIETIHRRKNGDPKALSQIQGQSEIAELASTLDLLFTETEIRNRLLEDQQKKLIQAAKLSSIGEMAGGIAHEINNPLAIILTRAFNLINKVENGTADTKKIIDELKKIEDTADRISKIIRGLRSYTRDSHSDPFESVQTSRLLNDTLDLCSQYAQKAGVTIVTKNDSDPKIECRPTEITQILVNLVKNSIDAIAQVSEKWIEIEVEDRSTSVNITVTDSGPGITEEVASKIMQPFFTTKGPGKGTGLGLSVSMSIAVNHHGTLNYDRSHARTRFVLSLPVKQPAGTPAPTTTRAA